MTSINHLSMMNEEHAELQLNNSPKISKLSQDTTSYVDIFTSNEILPYFIVSFREYILVVSINIYHRIKSTLSKRKPIETSIIPFDLNRMICIK